MRRNFIFALMILTGFCASAQTGKETQSWFDAVESVVRSEGAPSMLAYRLDSLKAHFIPSRSYIDTSLWRELDFGYMHRRILVTLDLTHFQVDLLTKGDNVILWSVSCAAYRLKNHSPLGDEVQVFVKRWNKFYSARKQATDLVEEISSNEVYALRCGDGMPQTKEGRQIDTLVAGENIRALAKMLASFSCERQSFGVAGIDMLVRQDVAVGSDILYLADHIKQRNARLVTCSGCISGIIEQIYSR